MESTNQLDYAPTITRRRQLTQPLLLLLLVATAAWAMYLKREQFGLAYRQWKYRGLAAQCLSYTAPADQVMYDEDPNRAAALLARPGYVPLLWNAQGPLETPGDAKGTIAGFVPECWRRFEPYTRTPVRRLTSATVFMHERTTPSGARRLVVVEVQVISDTMQFAFDAIDLDQCRSAPRTGGGMVTLGRRLAPSGLPMNLRIFARQADKSDPTHFSLPFEWNGRTGTIEVYLTDERSFAFHVDSRDFSPAR